MDDAIYQFNLFVKYYECYNKHEHISGDKGVLFMLKERIRKLSQVYFCNNTCGYSIFRNICLITFMHVLYEN